MSRTSTLTVRRILGYRRAEVFEAWRSADLMSRWFSADGWHAQVSSTFEVGGAYRIEMTGPAGERHAQFGEYVTIEPDARITFTWNCKEIGVSDSVVDVHFDDHPAGTEMTLVHALPDDPELVDMHNEGWQRCLDGLERLLEGQT